MQVIKCDLENLVKVTKIQLAMTITVILYSKSNQNPSTVYGDMVHLVMGITNLEYLYKLIVD